MKNFSLETVAQIYARGRNYVNNVIGMFIMFGIMTASQQKSVMDGLSDIWTGLSQAFTGASHVWQVVAIVASPFVTEWLAKKAGNAASTQSQADSLVARSKDQNGAGKAASAAVLDAVTKLDDVKIEGKITAPAEVAQAVPSDKVVAK